MCRSAYTASSCPRLRTLWQERTPGTDRAICSTSSAGITTLSIRVGEPSRMMSIPILAMNRATTRARIGSARG